MKNFETFAGVPTQPLKSLDTISSIVEKEAPASKLSHLDKKAVKKIVKKALKKEEKRVFRKEAEKARDNATPQSLPQNEPIKKSFGSFFRKLGDAVIKAIPAVLVTVAGIIAKSFFGSLCKMKGATT